MIFETNLNCQHYISLDDRKLLTHLPFCIQLVERQKGKLEEQKEENVEVTQELRLTRSDNMYLMLT